MKKKSWIWIIVVVVLVVVVIAGFLWSNYRAQANANAQLQTAAVERGDLTATIGATGTVRARQLAVLAWQTSGSVDVVNVSIGEHVKTGDVLASLSKSSLSQNIILAEADLISAQRNLETLLNSNTPGAQAMVNLTAAQKAYEDAEEIYDDVTGPRASQAEIDNANAQYIIAQANVDRAQAAYDALEDQPDDDRWKAQAYTNLYSAIQARDDALEYLNWLEGQSSELEIAQAEAQLALAKARLEDAQREWDRLKNGPDAADILAAQARVTAIQATLNMTRITAPFAGTVTGVQPLPGDQVAPGTTAFRIDDLSRLLVDVQVSEVDINSIKVNQSVTLTLDAILGSEYHGIVIQIAQTGNNVSGSVYFTVTVELTDADEQVKPGMTAAVTIVVNELKDVLLVQNRAVRLMDGKHFVYVLVDGSAVQIEIILGATSDTVSEVIGGDLHEGDTLILNPSAQLTSGNGHPSFMGP